MVRLLPGQGYLVFWESGLSEKPGFNGVAQFGEVSSKLGSMQVEVVEEKRIPGIEHRCSRLVSTVALFRIGITDRPIELGALR